MKKFLFVTASFLASLIIYASAAELVPLGSSVGIKLASSGAMIMEISPELSENPAKKAKLAPGDIIKSVNGEKISSNEVLKDAIESCEGRELTFEIERGGKTEQVKITPVKNESGSYSLGVWIRDSIAGIGTMTYYNPEDNSFGALGHGINDTESNCLIPIEGGVLGDTDISEVKKGKSGSPGELIGEYDASRSFGNIEKNTESGIFGTVFDFDRFSGKSPLETAKFDEIKTGKATILCNLGGCSAEEYEIEIEAVYHDKSDTKNMLIRATDERLLDKTGGIVRGMSGSPIIQNGKIVGAVTHVLINDPTRGYAIFIDNMLKEAG